jgi:hypothetical protein
VEASVRHFRSWIAGRRARIMRGSPSAPSAAAGMLGVNHYNAELEDIGNRVQVWRLRGENDRDMAFRIAVAIATRLNELEADLERVIRFNKVDRP